MVNKYSKKDVERKDFGEHVPEEQSEQVMNIVGNCRN